MTHALPEIITNPVAAVATIKPGELSEVMQDSDSLIAQAGRVPADTSQWNQQTFAAVGDLRKIIKSRLKGAEDLRTAWTRPINAGVKMINEFFKERTAGLVNADDSINKLMLKYAREEDARRRAEQEKIRREAEEQAIREAQKLEEQARAARAAEDAAAASGDAEGAQKAAEDARAAEIGRDAVIDQAASLPVVDTAVRQVRGMYGTTSGVRKVWKAKLNDLRAIPDNAVHLIMADEDAKKAILKAMRSMIDPRIDAIRKGGEAAPLPGVVFEQEDSISIR